MRRIHACFLLLLFIPAAVLAQESINLSTPGYDGLSPYALPDGHILFMATLPQWVIIRTAEPGFCA